MATWLSEDDARERLVRAIAQAGSQEAFAIKADCSPSLVSRALAGTAPVGKKLGDALGLIAAPVKVFRYLDTEGR